MSQPRNSVHVDSRELREGESRKVTLEISDEGDLRVTAAVPPGDTRVRQAYLLVNYAEGLLREASDQIDARNGIRRG